jgi:hypothetical protein
MMDGLKLTAAISLSIAFLVVVGLLVSAFLAGLAALAALALVVSVPVAIFLVVVAVVRPSWLQRASNPE